MEKKRKFRERSLGESEGEEKEQEEKGKEDFTFRIRKFLAQFLSS